MVIGSGTRVNGECKMGVKQVPVGEPRTRVRELLVSGINFAISISLLLTFHRHPGLG